MDWQNSWLADFVNSSSPQTAAFPDPSLDFAPPSVESSNGESVTEGRTRSRSFSSRKDSPGISRKTPVQPAIVPPIAQAPQQDHAQVAPPGSFTAPPTRRSGNYSGVLRTSNGAPGHTPTQLISNISSVQDDTIVPRSGSPKRAHHAGPRPAAKSVSARDSPQTKTSPSGSPGGKKLADSVRRATTSIPFLPVAEPPPPPPRTDLPPTPSTNIKRAQSTSIQQKGAAKPTSPRDPPTRPLPPTPAELLVETNASPRKYEERPQSMHPAEKRSRVMHEILTSEETYIQGLERLVDGFMANIKKLGEKHAPERQIGTVFSNIEQILTFQREFCNQLKASIAVDFLPTASQAPPLGVVFIRMAPFLKSYAIYAANYATALTVLSEWRGSSSINSVLEQGRKAWGQDIEFYLILPIQRIPRYELLLRDLLAVTPETHSDFHELTEALRNVKQVADHVNSLVKQYQNSERAIQLGLKELMAPARRFVTDGVWPSEIVSRQPKTVASDPPVSARGSQSPAPGNRSPLQLILFNDMLIRNEGAKKKRNVLKSKYHWPIQLVWLREMAAAAHLATGDSTATAVEYPLEVLGPDGCYIIYFKSQQERSALIREFSTCIVEQMTTKDAPSDPDVRFGRYRFSDSGVYDGWWLRAKRHGMGTYALLGTKYIGEWLSDQMNGQGKLFYMNGSVYSGAFADGKPSGNGTVIDENGNTYEGRWQRGVKSGRGKLTFVDGSVYIGDFAMDRIEGRGVYRTLSGMVYEGSWLNDRFEGQGKLLTATGKEYTGQWKDGLKHGSGLLKYPDGSFYQGEFKDNKRHGQGTLDRSGVDGCVYTGAWVQGVKEGQGAIAFMDGTKYEGSFKQDQPNGVGVFVYGSGVFVKYSGEVLKGQRHGKGTLLWMKGARYEGTFRNDLMHGSGTIVAPNGLQVEGKWQAGRLEGKCTLKLVTGESKTKESKEALQKLSAFLSVETCELQFPEAGKSVDDTVLAVPHPAALPTLSIPLSYSHKIPIKKTLTQPPLPPPRQL